jgi:tetratricopeptide (TPR) repeat protein
LEDSGFDIAGSLRDIILSLDTTKEANRLPQFAEPRRRALLAREERRKNVGNAGGGIVIESPVTRRLLEIEKVIETKNYAKAETELKQLLEQIPSESRIYYALGRVAGLSAESITDTQARNRRLMEAKVHYTNVIRTSTPKTDAALLSLSYVALARIYEFLDDSAYALKLYEAAIKIGEVTNGAHKEAIAAQERLIKEQ